MRTTLFKGDSFHSSPPTPSSCSATAKIDNAFVIARVSKDIQASQMMAVV